MTGVSVFIERNPLVRSMAYFFEAGHESAPQAHEIMQSMFAQPAVKEQFLYAGHAFVEKDKESRRSKRRICSLGNGTRQTTRVGRTASQERLCQSLTATPQRRSFRQEGTRPIINETIMIADLFEGTVFGDTIFLNARSKASGNVIRADFLGGFDEPLRLLRGRQALVLVCVP